MGCQCCLVFLYLVLFIVACSFLSDLFIYTELPEHLNSTYCKCDVPHPSQMARVVNGSLITDPSYLPWTVGLAQEIDLYKPFEEQEEGISQTAYHVFCTGTGERVTG